MSVRNNPWTNDEIEKFRVLVDKHLSAKEIGEELGRSVHSIRGKLRELGMGTTPPTSQPWSEYEINELRRMADAGYTYEQIAEHINRTLNAIKTYTQRHNIEVKQPNRPWTDKDIENLNRLAKQGVDIDAMALELYRTKQSVIKKMQELKVHPNLPSRKWSKDSEELLKELWVDDTKTLGYIAKRLNRSKDAVQSKAKNLGLEPRDFWALDLTIQDVANEMGISKQVVQKWISKKGLPTKKSKMGSVKYRIDLDELLKWLEMNQDSFNAYLISEFLFTDEPNWLKDKRHRDANTIDKTHKRVWTEAEDNTLLYLIKLGKSWDHIGEKLNRSPTACKNRAIDNGYGKFRPTRWQAEEVNILEKYASTSTLEELKNMLPKRSERAIVNKLHKLNLKFYYMDEKWTEEEISILRENAENCTIYELSKLLPNRTDQGIRIKLQRLKLSHVKANRWTHRNKEEKA